MKGAPVVEGAGQVGDRAGGRHADVRARQGRVRLAGLGGDALARGVAHRSRQQSKNVLYGPQRQRPEALVVLLRPKGRHVSGQHMKLLSAFTCLPSLAGLSAMSRKPVKKQDAGDLAVEDLAVEDKARRGLMPGLIYTAREVRC